jgi:hypothetical protein
MGKKLLGTFAMLLAISTRATAQLTSNCSDGGVLGGTADACQKAADLFRYMAPQLGTAIAGGSATMAQGGALGGFPHFALGVRLNAVKGNTPQMSSAQPVAGAAVSSNYTTDDTPILAPTVDFALGIFRGFDVGPTTVLGADLLVNAAYVPEGDIGDISIKAPKGSLKIGYGARLGIVQEGLVTPGLGVTYLQRDLPVLDVTARSGNYNLAVDALDVTTTAWRIVASKNVLLMKIAVGGGIDKYTTTGTVLASTGVTAGSLPLRQEVSRGTYFADLSFNLLAMRATAEIGRVTGTNDITTFNRYDTPANDPRLYGSFGLRIGF